MSKAESPFSKKTPRLQLAWDSTSLRALMYCPEFYRLTILEGWRGTGVDLEFGIMYHSALEVFDRARVDGLPKDQCQLLALRRVLTDSATYGEDDVWEPWGGHYEELWHCTHNPGRGRKKCPYAHAGKWYPAPAPQQCGECGSEIHKEVQYVPNDKRKNRGTLVRAVLWYIEEQPEDPKDGVQTYVFKDGKAAVELSISGVPTGIYTTDDEEFTLAAHLDRVVSFGSENFISDRKTTGKPLSRRYFDAFSPDGQMDTYDLLGSIALRELELQGILIDAMQITQGGVATGFRTLYRNEAQRAEYLAELETHWFPLAERLAKQRPEGPYPKARSQCWLCHFKPICSRDPAKRDKFLAADFEKKPWNPLEER